MKLILRDGQWIANSAAGRADMDKMHGRLNSLPGYENGPGDSSGGPFVASSHLR